MCLVSPQNFFLSKILSAPLEFGGGRIGVYINDHVSSLHRLLKITNIAHYLLKHTSMDSLCFAEFEKVVSR